MMSKALAIFCASALFSLMACKSAGKRRASGVQSEAGSPSVALAVLDFDQGKLKSHLQQAKSVGEVGTMALWALMLNETPADAPCPGLAEEKYFFTENTDGGNAKVVVVTGKPMPMNGPCGLVFDAEDVPFGEVMGYLMESSPIAEIGTFDKIKLSMKQALDKAKAKFKTFTYRDGVKVYRHLHPEAWDYPWYVFYGESCGAGASVMINAATGEIISTPDAPFEKCS